MPTMCLNGPQVVKPDRAERCPAFKGKGKVDRPVTSCGYCVRSVRFNYEKDGSLPGYVRDMIADYHKNISGGFF